jgi:hypothetical protein
MIGSRPTLQGAVPTAAGRRQGLGRPTAAVVIAAKCGSYGCPCCSTRNIRRNRKRAALGVYEGVGAVAMVTATLDPEHPLYQRALDSAPQVLLSGRAPKVRTLHSGAESAASVKFVGVAWRRWVTAVRRLEPRWICGCRTVTDRGAAARRHERGCTVRYRPFAEMPFFKALELQKNGRAHIHVLVKLPDLEALFVSQGQLRALADRFGFGGKRRWRDGQNRLRSGFEIERARSGSAIAKYVAKVSGSAYAPGQIAGEVAKVGQQRTLPAYSRRASWSLGKRAWTTKWTDVRRRDLEWSFVRWDPSGVTRALRASGCVVDPSLFGHEPVAPAGGFPSWQTATA